MSNRPTYHEAWHRVAKLTPRLRSTVQTTRQHYRGRLWHVLCDPATNGFHRIDDAAYTFLGSLDGQRTVEQVWRHCQEHLGDRAPTQGEALQLLGQLYSHNLLHADGAGDAAGMFDRHRKRLHQQLRHQLANFISIRVPLFDPDALLQRWLPLYAWLFRLPGLLLWGAVLLVAIGAVIGRAGELSNHAAGILDPANLFLLYLAFAGIKLVHEFGHAMACKALGHEESGQAGEVHAMGVMLIAFMPIPYVDASSAWALRNKWRRAFVAAAGMYVELFVAALAALVWAHTTPGSTVSALACNVMFIASFTTLLFNANPLLRYDGYYILSDLLEMPNLAQRSTDYLHYLVKKHVYGVRRPRNPALGPDEPRLLVPFGLASGVYRIIVSVTILLIVAERLFIVGMAMAILGFIGFVLRPLGQWVRYLATSPELSRVRLRAVGTSLATLLTLGLLGGLMSLPDRNSATGVVQPQRLVDIHMAADGFIDHVLPSGTSVTPGDDVLVSGRNDELTRERKQVQARLELAQTHRRAAMLDEPAIAQSYAEQADALRQQLERIDEQTRRLTLRAPFEGAWIVSDPQRFMGAYLRRGERIGQVAQLDRLIVRVAADQGLGPRLGAEAGLGDAVDIRLYGRPDVTLRGRIIKVLPAGEKRLPSPALGLPAGGTIRVDPADEQGTLAMEPFFEVQIEPEGEGVAELLRGGQRVRVRFELPSRPLLAQAWHRVRQLLQRRFEV